MRRLPLLLLSCLAVCLAPLLASAKGFAPTPNSVRVEGTQLLVDGSPFPVRGIAYSPVPVGEDVNFAPFGDYFTPDYAYLWKRDMAAMKAMGINTLRIYSWATNVNHMPFLDTCHRMGLKVIITHYLGSASATKVESAEERQAAVDAFANHVKVYGDHPAILMWSIGNEVNGWWLDYKTTFSNVNNCGWSRAACENNVDVNSKCHAAVTCVYTALFSWVNDMATAGKQFTTRPMTSAFADVDMLVGTNPAVDRLARFDSLLPAIDVHTIQLYRGRTFGNYFQLYGAESSKPLLVGEYGVDAYNDPCGWPENAGMNPCFNAPNNGQGGAEALPGQAFVGCTGTGADCKNPGAVTQAAWDRDLAREIAASSVVVGGILFGWQDENWKGIGTEAHCRTPCPFEDLAQCADQSTELGKKYRLGGEAECTDKAHVTCSNYDTKIQDLCGYFLASAPDRYVNEQWFGANAVTDCGVDSPRGHRLSAVQPRPVTQALAEVWGAPGNLPVQTCDELMPCWQCTRDHSAAEISTGACNDQCGLQFEKADLPTGKLTQQKGAASALAQGWATMLAQLVAAIAALTYFRI